MALSRRAEALSTPDADFIVFEVLQDPWHPVTNPGGWISLGVAENTLMHETLLERIKDIDIPAQCLNYGDGFKRLKAAHAYFFNRHFSPVTPVLPEHVVTSNGATTAVENLSWALANPGDAILVGRPHYGSFTSDLSRRPKADVRFIAFGDVDPTGMDGVHKYEEAILRAQSSGQRTAAILLAHPHNPLGRSYSREVLTAYMRLCQRHGIHLISDEIYALSTFTNTVDAGVALTPFESILSIDPAGIVDPGLIHVVWGMSKDFGANGLRMGCAVTQHNAPLRTALGSLSEFCWTSSLSDLVTASVLEDDAFTERYIRENQRRLGERYAETATWARDNGIEYAPGATAGFYIWVNLGAVYRRNRSVEPGDLDGELWRALVRERVFLADGISFGAEEPGWCRIVFSQPAGELEEGLRRIIRAIT